MNRWRYFMVSGGPTAFYIPIVEQTNLRLLEKQIEDWLIEMIWADPTALPPWCPGSRHDPETGYNGSLIDSNFFSVRIHRYKAGAQEIDLSSASCVRAYLFSFDESRQYGEQWQVLRLNNPKCWAEPGAAEMIAHIQENWKYFWSTQTAHTKLDDGFLRRKIEREQRARQMNLWEDSLAHPGESYGGTE